MSSVRLVTAFSRLIPLILAPIACSLAVSNELDSKNPNNTRTDAGETADANEASPPKDAGNAWDSNPTIDAAADAPIDVVNEPEASVTAFCNAIDPDLAACYQFDVPENLGLDESQYGNHASVSNVNTMPGISGTALVHGPTSIVQVVDSPSLNVSAVTIDAWIRPTELPITRSGVFDNDGQYGLFLQSTGQLRCSTASQTLTSTPAIAINTWTHVACSYDGASLAIYLDGKRTDEISATGPMFMESTVGSCIGSNSPSGDEFIGAIDQLRVWGRALSETEICEAAGACPQSR